MNMYHKKIETKEDAMAFLKSGKRASDILERLEMLDSLLDNSSQEEVEETEEVLQSV